MHFWSPVKLKIIVVWSVAYTCMHSRNTKNGKLNAIGTGPDWSKAINLADHMQSRHILLVIMKAHVLELVKGPSGPAYNELPCCRAHRVIWLHRPNGEIISNQFRLSYGAFHWGEDLIRTLWLCEQVEHIFGVLGWNAIAAVHLACFVHFSGIWCELAILFYYFLSPHIKLVGSWKHYFMIPSKEMKS